LTGTNPNLMSYAWMICASLAFASMGALTHGLRSQCGWEFIALVRSVVLVVLSGLLAARAGIQSSLWKNSTLWFRSVAGTISMLCVFFSFTRLPVAIVVTLMNLAPAWVAVLSWPMLRQTVGKGVGLAVAMGLVGVALIQQPQLDQGNFAVLAPLLASLAIAVVLILLHRLKDVDPRAVVFHFAVVSFVGCLAAVMVSGALAISRTPSGLLAWGMLIGVGFAATAGQLSLTAAFASGSPDKLSVVGLTQVGFAMLYDVVIWKYEFDAASLVGITLIVAPTAWLLARDDPSRDDL
jgi:drug/metabolite transporter (DMT)-like permease